MRNEHLHLMGDGTICLSEYSTDRLQADRPVICEVRSICGVERRRCTRVEVAGQHYLADLKTGSLFDEHTRRCMSGDLQIVRVLS